MKARLASTGALLGVLLAACASSHPPAITATGPINQQANRGPDNVDAAAINMELGVGYLRQGDLALAQQKLLRALREDPSNANVHGALALLDERLGKVDDADKEYRRALRLSHDSPDVLNNYAVYLCSHNRADEGVRYLDEAAANPLYRTPWVAYDNAGVCLQTVHRDAAAEDRFVRALQTNPTFADAAFHAGMVDFTQEHYVEARLRIELFLMNNPATPDLLLLAWRIAGAQQDTSGQERYAARLAKEFPQSGQARAVQLAATQSGAN